MARKNYCRSVFVLIIVLTLMPAGHAFAQYDRSGPWWAKLQRPMLGVAYTAEPSDYNNTAPIGNPTRNVCNDPSACKYFDSDFTNADFSLLWGPAGRDDLDAIRKLKMNFIALYDWVGGFCRDHKPFLAAAWNNGGNSLRVAVPISDFNVQSVFTPATIANIQSILYEIYGLDSSGNGTPTLNPAVAMWRIGNEVQLHDIALANAAQVVKIIVNFENEKNIPDSGKLLITSDVDFGILNGLPPGISQLEGLQQAFISAGLSDIWYKRFIASINTTNPGSFIDNYVKNVFSQQSDFNQGAGLALLLTEYGIDSPEACSYIRDTKHLPLNCNSLSDQNKAQAEYDQDEFQVGSALANSPNSSSTGYFFGFAAFQWQDAFWKCPNRYSSGNGCTESLFGIQTVGAQTTTGSIAGGRCGLNAASYPVNALDDKPVYKIIPGSLSGNHLGKGR